VTSTARSATHADNSTPKGRPLERDLRRFRRNAADPALASQLAAYFTRHPAFAECTRLAYATATCREGQPVGIAGDAHLPTGLLDPENMHAGDPLMDFVRRRVLHDGDASENGRAVLRLRRLRTRTATRPVAPVRRSRLPLLPHRARS
jgi:hypothetical protein